MKKEIIFSILCLSTVALVYGIYGKDPKKSHPTKTNTCKMEASTFTQFGKVALEEFYIAVDQRFVTKVKKSDVLKAKSIMDFLPNDRVRGQHNIKNVHIKDLSNEQIFAISETDIISEEQRSMLINCFSSADFLIRSSCDVKNTFNDEVYKDTLIYYLTMIPEVEAQYPGGIDNLNHYLKESLSQDIKWMDPKEVGPSRMRFNISKYGVLQNVRVENGCGIASIDSSLVEIIKNLPHNWTPAKDMAGNPVSQDFVFFYGQRGC